jgi:hypothetical protein
MFGKKYTFVTVTEAERQGMKGNDSTIYVCWDLFRADFICPCGCGEWVTLNLIPNTKPCWKIALNSITPSIQRTVGCKSHFFINNGTVSKNQKHK